MSNTTELSGAKRALLEKYLRGSRQQTTTGTVTIARRFQGSTAPLSFGQQQLWLLVQLMPDTPVYNESQTIYLPGPLDVAVLEQSFHEIIRRHEAWRTSFPMVDGQPVQMIHPLSTLTLPVVDLRHLPGAEREAEALRLAMEEARRPFDLAHGPLLRATLMRLGHEDHRLFLFEHHIIFDAFSLYQVFLPEFRALYEAFSIGQPSPLPELPIQYADFAVWQREWLQGDRLADQLTYWKQQLAGAPAALELPTDRPRPPVQTHHGSIRPFALSKPLTDALKALSHQEGVTLFIVLAAAFQTLLHRYTGQNDILIGTLTSDRKHPQTQGLLGFFLNTLALRTDLSGNPTFSELLRRVCEVTIEAHTHQDVPFEYVVKELQPQRNLAQNPLIQVVLTLESPQSALPSEWTMNQMEARTGTSKFDLTLDLEDRSEGLIGRLEYNTDLFDAATIDRLVGHWQTLLEGIVADPGQRLAQLPLLTQAERQQLLVDWNATQTAYPEDRCIHQLFEDQVRRTPDAVAVIYEGKQLTYRELNAQANQLANYLQQSGVGPEALVGICVERSLEMVVGLLGILKAGGAYVPLDPTYPSERIAFMLEDAQVAVLVTQQHLAIQLPAHAAKVVCLDSDEAVRAQQSEVDLAPGVTPNNLAYVIYTSGSTGRPNGVQILHRAVVNFLISMGQQPGLTAEDTLLAVTTLSFDIAALELFLPLIVGARLIIVSHDVAANGAALAETLTRSRATVMQATPVTWRLLLAAGWQGDQHLKILCGGEALPLELAQQLLPKAASLWNMYGPTETTIWSSVCKIEPGDKSVSIGRPIANTQMYLLDTQLQLVPVGVPGELYIGGDGLARGYLNRLELTDERFIPHPFSDEPGARLYKTGDLACYQPDGTIKHLGRLDFQVKIRGFRIELGEIETVLGHHPAVHQAVVVAREDVPGDKRLVAYVVLHEEQVATVGDLQSHVMKQLPAYMVPSTFVLLDVLPTTPNGKVDRHALPVPDPTSIAAKETYVAPVLMVHHQLVQIWEELLGVRPIGIKDNFFDLGGHSLLAARMVNQFEQVCGKKIPLATLFAEPTIEQLAEALQQQEDRGPRTHVVAVQTGESKRPFFFLHGDWTMGAFYCFTLARTLGSDQPFYVLEPYRIDGLHIPPTLEAMAAAHLKSLRAVQPQGPYLLGGFCNGGLLAYEIARQLHAEGQKVDLLVLINPSSPAYLRSVRDVISRFGNLMRFSQDKQADYFLRLRHALRHVYRYLHSSNDKRLQDFGKLITVDSRLDAMLPPAEALRKDYIGVFTWLASGYMPGHYPGKITFFWSSEEPALRTGWRKVAKATEVESHDIPGAHMSCVTEHIHVLAEHLSMCLREVQGAASSKK